MKEIKFRAWDGNKMREWDSDIRDMNNSLHVKNNSYYKLYYLPMSWMSGDSNDWIWMQYTGLKDKNGKEIYEGDIIRSKENDEVFKIGEMTPLSRHLDMLAENIGYYDGKKYHLRSGGGQYHLDDWVSWPEMYEIIGNIYEHGHLLADMGSRDKI